MWHLPYVALRYVATSTYITVGSATTALQNCACTYRCISKKMHYKTHPFHTTATWNIWNFMKTTSLCSLRGIFLDFFFVYCIQHCFICRPSDSTVSEDAGIEPRTVATTALTVRRSNHSAKSHPLHYSVLSGKKLTFWDITLTQNHAGQIAQSGWNNYLV